MGKKSVFLGFILVVAYLQICLLSKDINYKKIYKKYIPRYGNLYENVTSNYELMNEYYDFIPAKITNVSNGIIRNIYILNKGYDESIHEKSFVVNEDGLFGEIVKTFKHYSVVRSVFSNSFRAAIETNACFGTLYNHKNSMIIDDLINCDDVSIGDAVFTSKYNYSSSNILIGYIEKNKDNRLYVKPAINKYKVRYVGVINDSY